MKVICKETTAKNLDPKEVSESLRKDHEFTYITIGSEYIVMGLAGYKNKNGLSYLIDNGSLTDWAPYGLFEISDKAFPPNWHIEIINKSKYPNSNILWLAGFYELCTDENYHDALIEREPEAFEIYWKRKAEFKQWYVEREEARKFYPKEAKIYYSIND
jgi:hypothetical protein